MWRPPIATSKVSSSAIRSAKRGSRSGERPTNGWRHAIGGPPLVARQSRPHKSQTSSWTRETVFSFKIGRFLSLQGKTPIHKLSSLNLKKRSVERRLTEERQMTNNFSSCSLRWDTFIARIRKLFTTQISCLWRIHRLLFLIIPPFWRVLRNLSPWSSKSDPLLSNYHFSLVRKKSDKKNICPKSIICKTDIRRYLFCNFRRICMQRD